MAENVVLCIWGIGAIILLAYVSYAPKQTIYKCFNTLTCHASEQ